MTCQTIQCQPGCCEGEMPPVTVTCISCEDETAPQIINLEVNSLTQFAPPFDCGTDCDQLLGLYELQHVSCGDIPATARFCIPAGPRCCWIQEIGPFEIACSGGAAKTIDRVALQLCSRDGIDTPYGELVFYDSAGDGSEVDEFVLTFTGGVSGLHLNCLSFTATSPDAVTNRCGAVAADILVYP